MFKKILDTVNKKISGKASQEHVGHTLYEHGENTLYEHGDICPKCGMNILKGQKQWTCEGVVESSCNIIIPRYTPDGEEITKEKLRFYLKMFRNTSAQSTVFGALEGCFNSNTVQEPNEPKVATNANNSTVTEKVSIATTQPETTKSQQPKNTVTDNVVNNNTTTSNNGEKVDVNGTQNKTQDTNVTNKQNNNQQNSKEDERAKLLKSDKKRKIQNKCSCGGTIYRYGYQVACDKCNFLIGTKYANISFSDDEMSQLIGKRVSKYKTFTKKDGTEFKGRVFIDFDANGNLIPDYKFVNSPKNINGHYKQQLFAPDEADRKNIPLSELFNKSNYSNNNSKNYSSNVKKNNESGAGDYKKFDPFKDQADKGTNNDDYKSYLKINDNSEPF